MGEYLKLIECLTCVKLLRLKVVAWGYDIFVGYAIKKSICLMMRESGLLRENNNINTIAALPLIRWVAVFFYLSNIRFERTDKE